jgi:putative glutamine amidotransferase
VEEGSDVKRIGITCGLQKSYRYGIHRGYSDAVTALGALPTLLSSASVRCFESPDTDPDLELKEFVSELLAPLDAVIVTGGWDVDPFFYGEEPSSLLQEIEPERDRLELAIIAEARVTSKRLLAICRGLQILNVEQGGTLYQDLSEAGFQQHSRVDLEYSVAHEIVVESRSELASVLGGATGVNTLHHQGIKELAPTLTASAYSPDGVIEAVEMSNALGVQWHPERLFEKDRRHLGPFQWLIS